MKQSEQYGSRLGMMLVMLGMAVGTGNIWRFPRIAAQNGGGEFLIAWILFLFLWSIPLILLEFAIGRKFRCGPVKAFIQMMGPGWAWMGAFTAFVTVAIMFYYSVVAGWTIRYSVAALMGEIPQGVLGSFWENFTQSWWPVLTHGVAIGLATWVVARGIGTIERVAKILMPTLVFLVIVLAIRALTLPGSSDGLAYLFDIEIDNLARPRLWLEALTQNAWDTGAGWGLVLCYSAYLRDREDTALNAFLLPTANNMISLLAGIMIICTVFSVVPGLVESDPGALRGYSRLSDALEDEEVLTTSLVRDTIFQERNEGLTFTWMPQLFQQIPLGRVFMVLFFVSLSFAAFTSLIAMVELATRVLVDGGLERLRAITVVGTLGFVLGLPSAMSIQVLRNQDWVWSLALMLGGLFFAIAGIRHGIQTLREQHLNHKDSDIRVGRWWNIVIGIVVPIEAGVLFVWWLLDAWSENREGWLSLWSTYNVGTALIQFSVLLSILFLVNRWIVQHTIQK